MTGIGASPAVRGEVHDRCAEHLRERWSRRRLLHRLLIATLAISLPTVALSLTESARVEAGFPVGQLAGNLVFLVVVATLVFVNRGGRTLLASWVFCGALVLNGSEFFPLSELDRALALYAVPIMLAATLIRPAASFELLGLSVADYLLAYLRHSSAVPFNWFSLVVLAGVACASWLVARRAAWFEETEEMYRLELDSAVAERDELGDYVTALRGELDAERSAATRVAPEVWASTVDGAPPSARSVWPVAHGPDAGAED